MSLLPLQSPCRFIFEYPHRPPHLLRKAYAEKLAKERLEQEERLQEKERLQQEKQQKETCQSPVMQRASQGQTELHVPGTALEV